MNTEGFFFSGKNTFKFVLLHCFPLYVGVPCDDIAVVLPNSVECTTRSAPTKTLYYPCKYILVFLPHSVKKIAIIDGTYLDGTLELC